MIDDVEFYNFSRDAIYIVREDKIREFEEPQSVSFYYDDILGRLSRTLIEKSGFPHLKSKEEIEAEIRERFGNFNGWLVEGKVLDGWSSQGLFAVKNYF
ncbi:MAG: hypothetical protein AABW79_00295 [Nanoarchaeota archaeon]